MVAQGPVLRRGLGLAFAVAISSIAAAHESSSRFDEDYRSLTAALDRAEFDSALGIAARLSAVAGDSLIARKARDLARLAEFLRTPGAPPPEQTGVSAESGALRLSIAPDLAFAATTLLERGVSPLLFGHPAPFSSRVTLAVDGEVFAPSGNVSLGAAAGRVDGRIVERGIETSLSLVGGAPPSWHPRAADASVRVEVVVTNRSDRSRTVGARLLLDLVSGFDDAPLARIGPGEAITSAHEWLRDAVPRRVSIGARSVLMRGLGAPAPDRALLAPLALAEAKPFDFALDLETPLGPDSALALYAEPRVLAPGESLSLVAELTPDGDDVDDARPIGLAIFSEPAREPPGATRFLLLLRGGSQGTIGEVDAVSVAPRLDSGLELIESPPDLESLGSLAPGFTVQRSIVVRPDLTRSGALGVAFEIGATLGSGALAERSSRRIEATVSAPSRVTLAGRILDPLGRPVPDCEVVVRQGGRDVATTRSDPGGAYRVDGLLPEPCEVRASRVVFAEPAAKQARAALDDLLLDVVLTSETIDDAGNHRLPTFSPGSGRDVVLARSLTRYSMLVVVEWDATREYLDGIARGMRKAAEFLYAASDGHFTFGRIAIRDCGVDWNHADFWDWANNSVHPNASVAGIRHRYHPRFAPWNTAINFGRQWDSSWEGGGLFTTVVHEFGHYGFGLFDEYLGAPQGVHRGLSYPEMCRCIMGYQYSDHKICFAANHLAYTNQGMWNGRSCWEQLEAMHEGARGGYFAAVTTPAERNGVTPPPVKNSVGDALRIVIDDHSTGGRDVPLELVGVFGRAPYGVPVYTTSPVEGRTVYHGVTDGSGRITLMGVHPGDRVSATYSGARAETTLRDFAPARLEFGSEPNAAARAPIVLVTPESIVEGGRRALAGAALEIFPGGPETRRARIESLRAKRVELPATLAADGRFVAFANVEELPLARGAFALMLDDARDGEIHATFEVVVGEGELHSFDGAIEVIAEATRRLAIASASGPDRIADGSVVDGRVTSIVAERGESVAIEAEFVAPASEGSFELRSVDPFTRVTRPIDLESIAPGRFRARIVTPATIAWCRRD